MGAAGPMETDVAESTNSRHTMRISQQLKSHKRQLLGNRPIRTCAVARPVLYIL